MSKTQAQEEAFANPLLRKRWPPYVVGAAIGVLSWFAFATADHGLGITSAFEHTAALALRAVAPALEGGSYFEAARAADDLPKIGWEWMLVLGVFLGAVTRSPALALALRGGPPSPVRSGVPRRRDDDVRREDRPGGAGLYVLAHGPVRAMSTSLGDWGEATLPLVTVTSPWSWIAALLILAAAAAARTWSRSRSAVAS